MAEITAKMVADLRAATGLGMMECKKALVETEGDVKAAGRSAAYQVRQQGFQAGWPHRR